MQMTLSRGAEIFTALGRKTAANWGEKQLISAIAMGLTTLATPEALAKIADPTIVADINQMLTDPEGVTIVEAVAAPAKAKAKAKAAAPAAPVAAAPAAAPVAAAKGKGRAKAAPVAAAPVAPAAPAATKGKGKAKAAPAAAPAAPAAAKGKGKAKAAATPAAAPAEEEGDSVNGVRFGETRPFLCGQTLAEVGMLTGVTDEMVAAVDEASGKPNPRESRFALRNGWQAVRGYMGWGDADTLADSHGVAVDTIDLTGVRINNSRHFLAGQVIASYGLSGGVTAAMAADVEALLPEDMKNPRESAYSLRIGWHAIRGYLGVTDLATAEAADAAA